jgi:hypothetical protein
MNDIEYLEDFASRYGLRFKSKGECGFGRYCCGLMGPGDEEYWLGYNQPGLGEYDDEFFTTKYDKRFDEIKPEHAYHKDDYFTVLTTNILDNGNSGIYKEAIRQLREWCEKLEEIGFEISTFEAKEFLSENIVDRYCLKLKGDIVTYQKGEIGY